jgi:hypothetical protein
MTEINDQLLSSGTAADSGTIQIVETLAVVSAAIVLGCAMIDAVGFAFVFAAIAAVSVASGYMLRRERVLCNETAARDARAARYTFPPERADTIRSIAAPDDLKTAALAIMGGEHLSRLEISARLSARIGQARASEYLPLVLQYADRDVEGDNVVR